MTFSLKIVLLKYSLASPLNNSEGLYCAPCVRIARGFTIRILHAFIVRHVALTLNFKRLAIHVAKYKRFSNKLCLPSDTCLNA